MKNVASAMFVKAELVSDEAFDSLVAGARQAASVPLIRTGGTPAGKGEQALDVEPINAQELLSLYAMLAWVAHRHDVRQDIIQMMVEAEFGVDSLARICRCDFRRAMDFLTDLRFDNRRD
jgi:hypothetical protein